jgi:hypothetical protein
VDRKRSNTKFLELSLHHVEDLGKDLDKIANLLCAGDPDCGRVRVRPVR